MSLFMPSKFANEPALKRPGRKPVGAAKLSDSSEFDYFTKDLAGYFLCNTAGKAVNLAGPDITSIVGAGGSDEDPVVVATERGLAFRQNDRCYGTNESSQTETQFFNGAGMTYAMLYRLHTHQTSGGGALFLGRSNDSARQHFGIKDYEGGTQVILSVSGAPYNIGSSSNGKNMELGVWALRFIRWNNVDTELALYQYGNDESGKVTGMFANVGSVGQEISTLASEAGTGFRFGIGNPVGNISGGASIRGFDGDIAWVGVWKDGLSAERIDLIARDLYAPLKPKGSVW